MTWGIFKDKGVAEAIAKVQAGEQQQLDEAAVSTIAKAHGFEKQISGMDKGSYKHPKTGETITPLRGGSEYGHSRKDGSTVAAFKHKDSLESHLAKHGYVKEECIEDYSLEELQEFMVSEDFEQLDELSKTTLGNYIKKAANDKADTAFHRGYSAYNNSRHKPYSEPMYNKVHRGQENRNKGIKRAVTKLTRESVEQLDEAEKTPAMKRAIGAAWKQRAKVNRTGDMAAGHHFTGSGNPEAETWHQNALAKYKKQRDRINAMKEEHFSEDEIVDALAEEIVEEVMTRLELTEAEKTPAMKRAIAAAWKQRAKVNRTGDMAAGHHFTGAGNPEAETWHQNALAKYKKQRERIKSMKEEIEQIEEGWDDMLKYVKDKQGPQPNGGSGKKQGTRYGGGKQKEDESEKRKEKNESLEETKESTMDEEAQKDIVKMGAKEIKHANVKDKLNDQEVMEPHSKGEQGFLDAHSVLVTNDPARGGSKTGADKLSHASEPKGKGPGSYDAKEKLGKQGVKEGTSEEGSSIEEGCTGKASGKKTFLKFKAEKKGN